jgi:hypothetical protein
LGKNTADCKSYGETSQVITIFNVNFQRKNGYDWKNIAQYFQSPWFSDSNLKRCGTFITAMKDKQEVFRYFTCLIF